MESLRASAWLNCNLDDAAKVIPEGVAEPKLSQASGEGPYATAVAWGTGGSGAVSFHDRGVAIGVQLEPAHAIEVDDRRAMDPAKDGRVQFPIEIREAAPQKMGFSTHMQSRIIIAGFDPIDVGRLTKEIRPVLKIT